MINIIIHSTIYNKIIDEFYKHDNKVNLSVYTGDGMLLTIIYYDKDKCLYYFNEDDIVGINYNMLDLIHPFLPDFFTKVCNNNAVCITASILGDERINSFIYKAVSSYIFAGYEEKIPLKCSSANKL